MEGITVEQTYFVTREADGSGQHFVHSEDCQIAPDAGEMEELGVFEDCSAAVATARETRPAANGCAMCASDCHIPARAGGAIEFDDPEAARRALGEEG